MRQQQTENWGNIQSLNEDFRIAVSCHDLFKVVSPEGTIVFETRAVNLEKNGGVRKFFKSQSDPSIFMI